MDVGVFAQFAKELGVLADDLTEGSGCGASWDFWLGARVEDNGEWLPEGTSVVHRC